MCKQIVNNYHQFVHCCKLKTLIATFQYLSQKLGYLFEITKLIIIVN